ncbi:MAG: serine/threonine-protein kinase [Nitrospiraceae bacterium]
MSRSWGWVGQYGMAIALALLLGLVLSGVPLFQETLVGAVGLPASAVARLLGDGVALVILWLLAHRAARALPADRAGRTFLRTILRPLTTVILVLLGYKTLALQAASAFGSSGTIIAHWLYVFGLLGATVWLTLAWVRNFGALTTFLEGGVPNRKRTGLATNDEEPSEETLPDTAVAKNRSDRTLVLNHEQARSTFGRYRILKELGRGAMGVVYLGKDPTIHRFVAIKTMRLDQVDEPDEVKNIKERFFREAESTGRLMHPNIVTIYDAGEEEGVGYIAMEHVDGTTLTGWCRKGSLLPVQRVTLITAEVAEALDYAHRQGVVHRDIKPANIMVTTNGIVKVMDFGIARITSSKKTQTGTIMGSPSYMSPEQVSGAKVDGRSDIFSLGVVLFELLTGTVPFDAENVPAVLFKIAHEPHPSLKAIRPELPSCAETILNRALHKDPLNRYHRARDLAQDLRACPQSLSV